MILLDWAINRLRGLAAPASPEGESSAPAPSSWRASHDQPSGLAQTQESLRQRMLELARDARVERVALLRADGSLFCGRNDAGREEFAASVQQIALASRRAARRMGLGAIESVTIEGDHESLAVAAGHSICGVQATSPALPPETLGAARALAGAQGEA